MGWYEDIRSGLKHALLLNEKVERLEQAISGLADDVKSLARQGHELDKRLVRIETMAEVSLGRRKRLEQGD